MNQIIYNSYNDLDSSSNNFKKRNLFKSRLKSAPQIENNSA